MNIVKLTLLAKYTIMKRLAVCFLVYFSFQLNAQIPEELGKVTWLRDFKTAQTKSAASQKPILLFFQEIPGCSTCKKFGNEVMSHALIAELIETYFVPVVVYNNLKGEDAKMLTKYGEPSWNNPVLRIVDGKGKDIIPRHASKYEPGSVISCLNKGIFQSGKLVPEYARLLESELNGQAKEITLEMYCFWSGEKNIGGQKGILYTEPGYSQGHEVVKVVFDENVTNAATIIQNAKKSDNADAVHGSEKDIVGAAQKLNVKVKPLGTYRIDKDVHYYLKNSDYASVPMTPIQATKVNSAIGNRTSPDAFLSPRQLALLQKVKAGKMVDTKRYLQNVNAIFALNK